MKFIISFREWDDGSYDREATPDDFDELPKSPVIRQEMRPCLRQEDFWERDGSAPRPYEDREISQTDKGNHVIELVWQRHVNPAYEPWLAAFRASGEQHRSGPGWYSRKVPDTEQVWVIDFDTLEALHEYCQTEPFDFDVDMEYLTILVSRH